MSFSMILQSGQYLFVLLLISLAGLHIKCVMFQQKVAKGTFPIVTVSLLANVGLLVLPILIQDHLIV